MGRLALFDLDDTLIALAPAFRSFAADFARARDLSADDERWLVGQWDPYQRRDAYFSAVRERFGLDESVADLWRHYRQAMPGYVVLRDEVRDGLVALRTAGWRLGIVTNGEADNQLGKVERTGLDRLVDAVAVSGALGVRKPDAEIFRIAAEGAGCSLRDGGWMVGDNPGADIGGGAAVGLRTVLVDPPAESGPETRRPRRPGLAPGLPSEPRPAAAAAPDLVVSDVTRAMRELLNRE